MSAAADSARVRAETIWADIQAGNPQPRPPDWPSLDAITAAAEQADGNNHCANCKEAS